MQNILHRGAKTTPKIRKEIHDSTESLMVLAQRYNLNFKTILKWKHREDFSDKPSGAIKPKSVLSDQEQAVICEFRRITQLPLDDVFVALKDKIPALTRSNLYRCLKRFGYQKLPKDGVLKKGRQSFKTYELGFIHLDIASLHTAEAKAQGDQSTLIECGYDYIGRRYTKKVTSNGTVSLHQRYIYRGYLQIACVDLTRSGHPALWYITWDPTEPVATRPLAIQKNATWYSYSHDLTKNVTELYQSDGLIATTYDYSPYGAATAEGIDQPIQYSSEYHDPELALTYYNYRHYNPTDGRWINRDPIHKTNSSNLYCFVFNSPLRWIDLLGREVDDDEVGVGWVVDPALEGVNVYMETGTKITSNTVKIQKEIETLAKTAKAGSLANAAAPSHLWSGDYNKNVSKIISVTKADALARGITITPLGDLVDLVIFASSEEESAFAEFQKIYNKYTDCPSLLNCGLLAAAAKIYILSLPADTIAMALTAEAIEKMILSHCAKNH